LQINLLNDYQFVKIILIMHVIEYCINAYNFMAPWEFHLKFMTTQATEGIYILSLLFGIIPKKKKG